MSLRIRGAIIAGVAEAIDDGIHRAIEQRTGGEQSCFARGQGGGQFMRRIISHLESASIDEEVATTHRADPGQLGALDGVIVCVEFEPGTRLEIAHLFQLSMDLGSDLDDRFIFLDQALGEWLDALWNR